MVCLELEAKLTVMPQMPGNPADLLTHLAVLPAAGPYRLGAATPVVLRDVYYDTAARGLCAARIGLRLRVQDGRARVTVKGKETWRGAVAGREEYEADLDRQALARALAPLVAAGLLPADQEVPLPAFSAGQPAGPLVPILTTETRRVHRTAYRKAGGTPVAILSLDRVRYASIRGEPVYFDVEIEALPAGTEEDLGALQQYVVAAAGGYLKASPESKLARGLRLVGDAG